MKYITTKRLKSKTISGQLNIPYGTECEVCNNVIYYKSSPVCYITSQIAYDYFSQNDDSHGLERGNIIKEIKRMLSKKDEKYQDRWDKLWNDEYCHQFRRKEHGDFWIWGFSFYNASIEDLTYILNKIKEVK